MAIAQFSDDARTEFKLNSYSDKEALLDAVQRISYKGGNTKTGMYFSLKSKLNCTNSCSCDALELEHTVLKVFHPPFR